VLIRAVRRRCTRLDERKEKKSLRFSAIITGAS